MDATPAVQALHRFPAAVQSERRVLELLAINAVLHGPRLVHHVVLPGGARKMLFVRAQSGPQLMRLAPFQEGHFVALFA